MSLIPLNVFFLSKALVCINLFAIAPYRTGAPSGTGWRSHVGGSQMKQEQLSDRAGLLNPEPESHSLKS